MLGALATGGGLKVPAPIVEESVARSCESRGVFFAWGCESRVASKLEAPPAVDGTRRNLASS